MKAVTLKFTVQTVNGWRAGYSESCKSGSGASARKPTAAMRQGAGYLAYGTPLRLTTKESSEISADPAKPLRGSVILSALNTSFPSLIIRSEVAAPITSGMALRENSRIVNHCGLLLTKLWSKSHTTLTLSSLCLPQRVSV